MTSESDYRVALKECWTHQVAATSSRATSALVAGQHGTQTLALGDSGEDAKTFQVWVRPLSGAGFFASVTSSDDVGMIEDALHRKQSVCGSFWLRCGDRRAERGQNMDDIGAGPNSIFEERGRLFGGAESEVGAEGGHGETIQVEGAAEGDGLRHGGGAEEEAGEAVGGGATEEGTAEVTAASPEPALTPISAGMGGRAANDSQHLFSPCKESPCKDVESLTGEKGPTGDTDDGDLRRGAGHGAQRARRIRESDEESPEGARRLPQRRDGAADGVPGEVLPP